MLTNRCLLKHLKMMCGLFWLRSAAVIQSRGARVQPQVNGGASLPEQWVCLLVIYLCVLRRSPLISSVYIHLHIKRKFQDMHTHHLKQAFFCSFLFPRFYLASCLHFDNCCLISFLYIDRQLKIFICRNVHTLASIQYMMLYDNDVLLLYQITVIEAGII